MSFKKLVPLIYLVCILTGCGGGSSPKNNNVEASSATITSSSIFSSSLASSASTSSKISSSSSLTTRFLLSYGDNPMQVGELRLPQSSSNTPLPTVIIIHGGCWVSAYASYHFMDAFAQAITDLGYVTWNIEYRALGTGGDWPALFDDVSKATDYVQTLAQTYPIDINNIAVIGHSAGGHLALWLASRSNLNTTSALYTQNPLTLRGAISLAGIANVTGNNSCFSLVNNIIGVPITPSTNTLTQRLQETSPLQMLPTHIKTILISGASDTIVPTTMGTEYVTQAVNLRDDSTHYILQGLGHFELIDKNKTNWPLYQQLLQEIFEE